MTKKILTIYYLLLTTYCLYAGGISTTMPYLNFGDVKSDEVYSLFENTGKYLDVQNNFDFPIDVKIEALHPDKLSPDYKHGNTNWIIIEKDILRIEPGKKGKIDVFCYVPQIENGNYQIDLWMHTISGGNIRVGLLSKVFLTVAVGGKKINSKFSVKIKKDTNGKKFLELKNCAKKNDMFLISAESDNTFIFLKPKSTGKIILRPEIKDVVVKTISGKKERLTKVKN